MEDDKIIQVPKYYKVVKFKRYITKPTASDPIKLVPDWDYIIRALKDKYEAIFPKNIQDTTSNTDNTNYNKGDLSTNYPFLQYNYPGTDSNSSIITKYSTSSK